VPAKTAKTNRQGNGRNRQFIPWSPLEEATGTNREIARSVRLSGN
jgi:hypothetical protein